MPVTTAGVLPERQYCGRMEGNEPRLAKLGFADDHEVRFEVDVSTHKVAGFGDPQTRARDEGQERHVCLGT